RTSRRQLRSSPLPAGRGRGWVLLAGSPRSSLAQCGALPHTHRSLPMSLSRRQFLAASAALASGGVATAIDPIKRPSDKPDLKLSLAAYSFRQALDLKKGTMTLFEFIDMAAELPLDAVELRSYYWAETTDADAAQLKA